MYVVKPRRRKKGRKKKKEKTLTLAITSLAVCVTSSEKQGKVDILVCSLSMRDFSLFHTEYTILAIQQPAY